MNAIQKLYYRGWRLGVLAISLALIAYLLYFHRLGTLLPGYNASEVAALHGASDWHLILNNPVNAPYALVVWLLTAVLHHHILMTRIVSASFGVLAVLLFYGLIRHWYDFRVTFLSTVLFATSAEFLHNARLGNGFILQMGILAFVSAVLWYRRHKERPVAYGYCLAALFAVLCYVPGLVWFEVLAAALLYKELGRHIKATDNKHLAGWAALFVVVLAPLLYAAAKHPHVLFAVSGLPSTMYQLSHFGSNLLEVLLAIGIRSPGDPMLWIGHVPLLSIAGVVLVIIGIYDYLSEGRLSHAFFWAGCILLSIILIGFGGSVSYALLVPLLYLFIAAGLNRLLEQWLKVFPRNPIARFVGIALICGMLFFSIMYQVRAYFIAWPYSKATEHAFNLPAPE